MKHKVLDFCLFVKSFCANAFVFAFVVLMLQGCKGVETGSVGEMLSVATYSTPGMSCTGINDAPDAGIGDSDRMSVNGVKSISAGRVPDLSVRVKRPVCTSAGKGFWRTTTRNASTQRIRNSRIICISHCLGHRTS